MKTRIIAAAVLVPVLIVIVLLAPESAAAAILGVLLCIAVYELLYRTGLVKQPRLILYSAFMAFAMSMWSCFGAVRAYFVLLLMVFYMLMFAEIMMNHIKVHIETVAVCFFAGVVIPYLLTALIRILTMESVGRYVILVPFIAAFMSDAGAYFVGIRYGKHKLAPVVSPNKTIEGVLGGLAGAVVGMLVYALILDLPLRLDVNYGAAILYGILGSAVGTFGDLCFSAIKRQVGIKDYGNLIPGHGGILDRFDSLTLVAPLMEALLMIMPLIRV